MKAITKDTSSTISKLYFCGFYIFLAIVSFFFLTVYSFYTSPFITSDNGYDAAFFRLVGQAMTKGYLPYRDFFDTKGPYLFLIEYIAQLISYGRLGIFFLQWINLFLTMILACQIYKFYGIKTKWKQIILLFPILYVACFTFEGGNLTEEFSLVPLMICLCLGLRHFQHGRNQCKVYDGFVYGGLFGFLLLIRVTNAVLICAVVFVISIDLLQKKQYTNLVANGITFIIGVVAATLPMLLFYGLNGLLKEMVEAVFIMGAKYSAEQTFLEHLRQILQHPDAKRNLLCFVPILTGLVLKHYSWQERLLLILGAAVTFVSVAVGNGYTHYFTLTLPLIAMTTGMTAASLLHAKKAIRIRGLVTALLIAAMLFQQYSLVESYTDRSKELKFRSTVQTSSEYEEIANHISPETADSVFCYNIHPNWYTYTDLFPCIRYCGWQNHYIELMPEIELDMTRIFQQSPPKWLVLPTNPQEMPVFLEMEISSNYSVEKQTASFLLLEHN